jgi:hypothetical protein
MIKKFFKNVWIQIVLGGALASLLFDWIKAVPILTSIKWVIGSILSVLNIQLSLWFILLAVLIGVLVVWLVINISVSKILPKYVEEYRHDTFRSWIWKWDWEQNSSSKKWEITNLRPYCQYCNCVMAYNVTFMDTFVKCPSCGRPYSQRDRPELFEHKSEIELLIHNKIEKQYLNL